jgi:hypothetical protein
MATAVSRTAGGEVAAGERSGAPWRTRGRTPGKVYSGDRSRGDAWEGGRQEMNGGEGRAVPRGDGLRRRQR